MATLEVTDGQIITMIPIAALASAGYFNLVWLLHGDDKKSKLPVILVSILALGSHALQIVCLTDGLLSDVSVTNVLTLVAFLMTLLGAIRYFCYLDRASYLVVVTIAAVCVWFPVLMPAPSTITHDWGLKVHIVLSISAYIAIGFAALYASFLLVQDHRLRRGDRGLNLALSLKDIEHTMISFTRFGEVLLTLSIVTGVFFINNVWEQHVAHKLIFGVISWLILAILLLRHQLRGFRGRQASFWLLSGFFFLALAYFGTAFVLQFLLQ